MKGERNLGVCRERCRNKVFILIFMECMFFVGGELGCKLVVVRDSVDFDIVYSCDFYVCWFCYGEGRDGESSEF